MIIPFITSSDCNHFIEISDTQSVIEWLEHKNDPLWALRKSIHDSLAPWALPSSLLPHEQEWIKRYLRLMEHNNTLNQLMNAVVQTYSNAVENTLINPKSTTKNQWLQLEYAERCPRNRKVHSLFSQYAEYKEGLIHWRIGAYYEKRAYNTFMLNADGQMKKAFLQETPDIRQLINQFDFCFLKLFSLRQLIRKVESIIVDGWEMAKLSGQLVIRHHKGA